MDTVDLSQGNVIIDRLAEALMNEHGPDGWAIVPRESRHSRGRRK